MSTYNALDLEGMSLSNLHFKSILVGRKYRRLCVYVVTLIFLISTFSLISALLIFDHQHHNVLYEYMSGKDDLVVLSATYFKNSKSYQNNTVVLLLNAHQVFHLKHNTLDVYSTNATGTMKSQLRIQQVVGMLPFYCKWVPFLAIGPVSPNMESLSFKAEEIEMKVSVREPFREKHDVVTCFTPLFLAERWQLILLTTEVYSHYGAYVQFYVRSMLTDILHLLRKYPNTRVTSWPSVSLGEDRANVADFDPNLELEFRNQAAAMTDCLLMYKESASYIIFPDPDDVIIPRNGDTFLAEFNKLFRMFPLAATIAYNMSQASLSSVNELSEYSPVDILRSVSFKGEVRWGKIVARPQFLDSLWIHESYGIRKGYKQAAVPLNFNSIVHLRFWDFESRGRNSSEIPIYDPLLKKIGKDKLVEEQDLVKIGENFEKRKQNNTELMQRLPKKPIYYPIIEKCYNQIFYNGESHSQCKGPELCKIPVLSGIRCTNTEASFQTFLGYKNLFIHILTQSTMQESDQGCSL